MKMNGYSTTVLMLTHKCKFDKSVDLRTTLIIRFGDVTDGDNNSTYREYCVLLKCGETRLCNLNVEARRAFDCTILILIVHSDIKVSYF